MEPFCCAEVLETLALSAPPLIEAIWLLKRLKRELKEDRKEDQPFQMLRTEAQRPRRTRQAATKARWSLHAMRGKVL